MNLPDDDFMKAFSKVSGMPLREVEKVVGEIIAKTTQSIAKKVEWCDGCDGTGLMEGWNRRDGNSCPKCKGTGKKIPVWDYGDEY